jgi:hypothetical protein
MNRFLVVIAIGLLSFGVAGCLVVEDDPAGPPDRAITCGHFDDFLLHCTSNCSPTWDCELNYDALPLVDQLALDDCSDCLAANLAAGYCDDCTSPDVGSCQFFMEDFLGVDCW